MDGNDDLEEYSRIPTVEDLVALCRNLNEHRVKYVVIGGFAVIRYLKPLLLIETKKGVRPKDVQNRNFLRRLVEREKYED